jgi:hypothetical protein
MNNYGRGVVFGGLILVSLLVLFFVGLNFVKAADVISSVTVTATGDSIGKDNWTKFNEPEIINFTITFTGVANGQNEANVTNITIIINQTRDGVYDMDLLDNATADSGSNGTSTSADGVLWNCVSLNMVASQNDALYSANREGIECLNSTASGGINISAAAANNFINIFFNITVNTTDKEQELLWIVEAQDQSGLIVNSTQVSTNVDSLAPRFIEINITDGNTTYSNGSAYYQINNTNILNGEQALTVELTVEDADVNIGASKPEVVELYYYTNGSDDANESARSFVGGVTRVNLTTTNSNSPYFYTGSISQADARAAIAGGAAAGHPNSTIISFVFFANDTQDSEVQQNDSTLGPTQGFVLNVTSGTPVLHEINATDGTNTISDLVTNDEWLKSDYGHVISFEVEGPLDIASTGAVGIRGVSVAYNSTGALIVGTNGYVAGIEGFVGTPNNLSVVGTANGSVVYNMSLDLSGNESTSSGMVSFAIIVNSSNGDYVSTFYRQYRVDKTPPSEPTLTVPTDRSIDTAHSIKYICSAEDSGAGGITYEWTLTKPSGVTVTKTGADVTWSSSDTNEAGTYNVECKATDKLGHTNSHKSTSTETFLALYTTVSAEGATGGGGAGGAVAFDVDFSVVSEASITGSEGRIRSFSFDGQTSHTITIKEVTDDSATIEVASDPITLALFVGETKEADVNADGANDMSVTLNNVKNGVADLTIKKIEEGANVVAGKEAEQRAREEAEAAAAGAEEVREAGGGLAWLWVVIILAAIIVIGYFVVKRK